MAFNTAERWAADVSEDVARKVMRRIDLAGDELVSSLEAFVERHLGPEGQRCGSHDRHCTEPVGKRK